METTNAAPLDLALYSDLASLTGVVELIVLLAILGGLLALIMPSLTRR